VRVLQRATGLLRRTVVWADVYAQYEADPRRSKRACNSVKVKQKLKFDKVESTSLSLSLDRIAQRVVAPRTSLAMADPAQNDSNANTPGTRTPAEAEDQEMRGESEDDMMWDDEHKNALLATRPEEREDSPGDAEGDGPAGQVDVRSFFSPRVV
jgi:hypothetical protein